MEKRVVGCVGGKSFIDWLDVQIMRLLIEEDYEEMMCDELE